MRRNTKIVLVVGVFFLASLTMSTIPIASADPLDQIIKGAKEEGKVYGTLKSIKPKSVVRLRSEIKDKYGVDLEIKLTPTRSIPKDYAKAAMEHRAGAPPTYDIQNFHSTVLIDDQGSVLERVDWKPLITKDSNPNVVLKNPALRGAIAIFTQHTGLLYNNKKVTAEEVPKTIHDMADPKWKGRLGIFSYTATWTRWAFILGKDKVLSDLRAIMKNKAIHGRFANLYNRFTLGEIDLAFIGSGHLKSALDAGLPAAYRALDFDEVLNFSLSLRKGARHPNAAKLLAVYLASPQGSKFLWEELKLGNSNYAGSIERDISDDSKKLGIPQYSIESYPGYVAFRLSDEQKKLQKEVKLILQTGK